MAERRSKPYDIYRACRFRCFQPVSSFATRLPRRTGHRPASGGSPSTPDDEECAAAARQQAFGSRRSPRRDKPGHCIEEHMDIDYTSLARCRRRSNTLWPMPMSSDIQHQSNLPLIGLTDRLIITRWMNHSNEFFKSCCEVLPLFQIHFSHVGTPFPKSSSGRSELR